MGFTEAVVGRYSLEKVFLEMSQNVAIFKRTPFYKTPQVAAFGFRLIYYFVKVK